jgi:hypothetical protein
MSHAKMRLPAGCNKICDTRVRSGMMFSLPGLGNKRRLAGSISICLLFFAPLSTTTATSAQNTSRPPVGIAWQVQGLWRVKGKDTPILTGDAIQPGALLQPGQGTINHSITVLLPDSQRVLYDASAWKTARAAFVCLLSTERQTRLLSIWWRASTRCCSAKTTVRDSQ